MQLKPSSNLATIALLMTNEELFEKISKLLNAIKDDIKEDMSTKEDLRRVQNNVESIELKVELNNARTARVENTVNELEDGLAVMQPKINEVVKDHKERLEKLEADLGHAGN
jgi:hypothetical protein